MKEILFNSFSLLVLLLIVSWTNQEEDKITPNQFNGTDIQRIQSVVDKAASTTGKVFIPADNSNGSDIWLIDSAILLPDNITVILENCTIQLSDSCRDNMFRNKNVGIGITDPQWNYNISIIGVGNVLLKGANSPRATGDGGKKLSLDPEADVKKTGDWRYTYGTDAGREGAKKTGDRRNIMILMAYVDGFSLKNISVENSHAWAVSHESVNAVAPGFIEGTCFHEKHTTKESAIKTIGSIPLGRSGNPEDVARAVAFLVSEYDGFITGVTLDINGGIYCA